MKSLDFRGSEISELEQKVDELMILNEKLRSTNKTKSDTIQKLESQ